MNDDLQCIAFDCVFLSNIWKIQVVVPDFINLLHVYINVSNDKKTLGVKLNKIDDEYVAMFYIFKDHNIYIDVIYKDVIRKYNFAY